MFTWKQAFLLFLPWLALSGRALEGQEGPGIVAEKVRTIPSSHDADVLGAEFSPDGRYIAAQSPSDTSIFETLTGKKLGIVPSRFTEFTPDSKFVVVHNLKGKEEWEVEVGARSPMLEVRRLPSLELSFTVTVEPRGVSLAGRGRVKILGNQYCAVGEKGQIAVVNLETGAKDLVIPAENRSIADVVLSGGQLIVGQGRRLQMWDLKGRKQMGELETAESILRLSPPSERYLGVYVSTVHRFETTSSIDPVDTAEFWDLSEKRKIALPGGACSAMLSPDGTAIVTGTRDGKIVVLDPASGKESGSFRTSRNGTVVVGLSSDGKRVLSADTTEEVTRVRVWNTHTGIKENSFPDASVRRIASDQAILEVGSTINVLDLKENRIECSVEIPGASSFTFLENRPLALRREGRRVEMVDLQSGKSVVSFEIPSAPGGYLQSLSSCRCGNHVLTLGADGSARLWGIPEGKESAVVRDPAWSPLAPAAYAFALDDIHYLLVSQQKMIRILSFADGKEVFSVVPHAGEHLPTVEVSPDGKSFITWTHDELKIWDARSHRQLRMLPGPFQRVLYCPEGCVLVLGDRKKVSVFDIALGRTLVETEVDFEVTGLSADHRFLLGWSQNLSVVGKERFQLIKYDLQSKAIAATLNPENYPLRQYLSRDGAHLLSHEGWGVRIYQVDPFRLLGSVTRSSSTLTSFVGKDKYFCTTEETKPAFAVWKLKP